MERRPDTSPHSRDLPTVTLPRRYNYIGVFLTFDCNLGCDHCINLHGQQGGRNLLESQLLTGDQWAQALNRIAARDDLPLSIQGGEPSLHPDFLQIISGVKRSTNIDLLTNLQFDLGSFTSAIAPDRLRREAPYASIRVSYHPQSMNLIKLLIQVSELLDLGYSVGIWAITHPDQAKQINLAAEECAKRGIDFRTKEFLGMHRGRLHGTYRYPDSVAAEGRRKVRCRGSELLIGPDGGVYRCHSDLYHGRQPIGWILDPEFAVTDDFLACSEYGDCNPCDVKVKTDRFQSYGHTSVEIKFDGEGDG